MSEAARKQPSQGQTGKTGQVGQPGSRSESAARGARKLAEWVSLAVSLLIVLGLAGYLVHQGLQPSPPYVPVQAHLLLDEVRQEGGRFILPVEVRNGGRRTLRDLQIEIGSKSGREELKREITLDFLAEESRQKTYVYYDEDPRAADLEATPLSYRLD